MFVFSCFRDKEAESIEWIDQSVRCAVIDLLKELKQYQLAKLCPLSQVNDSYHTHLIAHLGATIYT